MNGETHWPSKLYDATERRSRAAEEFRESLDNLNWTIRKAREAGMSAIEIADQVDISRQRVHAILREG